MPAQIGRYRGIAKGSRESYDGTEFAGQRTGNRVPIRARCRKSLNRIDDTVLVREAQRGERAAFEDLVRPTTGRAPVALRLDGRSTKAQDIYQEASSKPTERGQFPFRVFVLYLDLPHCYKSVPRFTCAASSAQGKMRRSGECGRRRISVLSSRLPMTGPTQTRKGSVAEGTRIADRTSAG